VSTDPSRVVLSTVSSFTAAASARLIGRVREVDPAAITWVLSIDGTASTADRVVGPEDLMLGRDELGRRIGRTTTDDAAAALLPELARLALMQHDEVLLLDPAIEVVGPLVDLDRRGDEALRLVPRMLRPFPVDDRHPNLIESHAEGIYLPTVLAAGAEADEMLSWWSEETARRPGARGALLTIATAWIKITECRSPGHGINPSRIEFDGHPISTIDTTGHDRDRPFVMGGHEGGRVRLVDHPLLADIYAGRDHDLIDDPRPAASTRAAANRRLYAEALRRHEILGEPEPPPPPGRDFDDWIGSPSARPDGLSRAAMGLWRDRLDLQAAFPAPDLGPANRREFAEWLRRDGVSQEGLDPSWVPVPISPDALPLIPGVDLAGYMNADLGVGEVARLLALALERNGTPTSMQFIGGSANQTRSAAPPDDPPRHRVEILCVNADRVAEVKKSRARDPESVRTIGVFFWETDLITAEMKHGISSVDEIWAGSRYIADNLLRWTERPVEVVPIPVVADKAEGDGRALLGVTSERPVVLFSFDFHSVARRKNPGGLVEAFTRAFAPDEGPVLILKSINGERVPDELDRLRWLTRHRNDIRIIDRHNSAGELSAMISAADIYASLHRSEGFGLTIAHAMALGTPVLCTAGSGPADFIDDHTVTVVPARKVPVGKRAHPYPADGTWWEPDLDAASAGLRKLLDDPDLARRQTVAAASSIAKHDIDMTAAFLTERLSVKPGRKRWRR